MTRRIAALDHIDRWDVPAVSVAVVDATGIMDSRRDPLQSFRIASVTKLLTTYAALVALEEGSISLDEPAGPPGATVRHLLSHAAGYGFSGPEVLAAPGRKRMYSNTGIEVFAAHLADRTGIDFRDYLHDAVLAPLGMTETVLKGSAAFAVNSTVADLASFARELLAPTLVSISTLDTARTIQFPGISGIVPGVGRFDPCDWGLGFERNAAKPGHWTGRVVSSDAYGHFGGSGTFLIVDPEVGCAVVCLTKRDFGPWAMGVWPPFLDAVFAELRDGSGSVAP